MDNRQIKNKVTTELILPLIIVLIIFILSGAFVHKLLTNHYYDIKKEESIRLVDSYRRNIMNNNNANRVITSLLEEKIESALITVNSYDEELNNSVLKELSHSLNVDEIDYYNSEGVLTSSNLSNLIGWEIYEGHPIDTFLKSDKKLYIEQSIREDVITGDRFRYGYIKRDDRSLIQVGVRAENIESFLSNFDVEKYISEMGKAEDVIFVCIIDSDEIIFSTGENKEICIEELTKDIYLESFIEDETNDILAYISEFNDEKIYKIIANVNMEGHEDHKIVLGYSLTNTNSIITNISAIVIISLIIVYFVIAVGIFIMRKKDKELIITAYYDSLTNLPNKPNLIKFLSNSSTNRDIISHALIIVDLSNFKAINLTYGYEDGDKIFKGLADKLKGIEDENIKLFRFSDYRFLIYIENYNDKKELIDIANKVNNKIRKPFIVKGYEQRLAIKMGIIEMGNKNFIVDDVLKELSITLDYASDKRLKNYRFFDKKMEEFIEREDLLEKEISLAIKNNDIDRIYLQFQPQINPKNEKVVGFEALARMESEYYGKISPVEFINIAERKQLMPSLGNLLLNQACDFIIKIRKEGFKNIKVAFNISGLQLLRENFLEEIFDIIDKKEVCSNEIEFEITESILLENFNLINGKLKLLRDRGISIAIDDFGTGYSSFYRLREISFDKLKIDRNFVKKTDVLPQNELITEDIIKMVHKFGMEVVAEGVETKGQLDYLKAHDCDIIQGYYFSKAISVKKAIEMLKQDKENI